jgi:hypothetical protein
MLDLFSLIIMLSAVFWCGYLLGRDKYWVAEEAEGQPARLVNVACHTAM